MADNYHLKNFKEILDYYKVLLNNVLNGSNPNPYMPEKWEIKSDDESGGVITYEYNPGYNYLKGLINSVEATKNGIYKGLRTLFINYDEPEDYWQEDYNYNIINSYASGSRGMQYYNRTTEDFEDRPEYWWTRGNYYDMLPMCTEGKYLLAFKQNVEKACEILESYKQLYSRFNCSYNAGGEVGEVELTYGYFFRNGVRSNRGNAIIKYNEPPQPDANGVYDRSKPAINWNYRAAKSNIELYYSLETVGSEEAYFCKQFWFNHLSRLKAEVDELLNNLFKIGKSTSYPEQTNDDNVIYINKYYNDGESVYDDSASFNSIVTNTQMLSTECGTYDWNEIFGE